MKKMCLGLGLMLAMSGNVMANKYDVNQGLVDDFLFAVDEAKRDGRFNHLPSLISDLPCGQQVTLLKIGRDYLIERKVVGDAKYITVPKGAIYLDSKAKEKDKRCRGGYGKFRE